MKKRGQKSCSKCGTINGARAYSCRNCHESFEVKNKHGIKLKKISKKPITNWQELNEEDCIKVLAGSGPYYLENGIKDCVGHAGKFIIKSIKDDGIVAYGISKKNSGFVYIYMGPKQESPVVPNLIRSPHKIMLCKKEIR